MRFIVAFLIGLLVAPAAQAAITTANVNCRATVAARSAIVERVQAGTSVVTLRNQGGKVLVDRRRDCWVASQYLADATSSASSARNRAYADTEGQSPARETRRANRRSLASWRNRVSRPRRARRSLPSYYDGGGSCPCSGSNVCVGPRGGRYCITSGGNKRYGV